MRGGFVEEKDLYHLRIQTTTLYTTTLILFLGGVQLLCVGFLGEYVDKMYQEVKGRSCYRIGKI